MSSIRLPWRTARYLPSDPIRQIHSGSSDVDVSFPLLLFHITAVSILGAGDFPGVFVFWAVYFPAELIPLFLHPYQRSKPFIRLHNVHFLHESVFSIVDSRSSHRISHLGIIR